MVFNMISAILSTPAGIIADRFGKRKTIIASYVLCSAIFFGFSHATNHYHGWILFISYGIFVAMNEGVQRAYVATVVKPECIATGYGVYHTVLGLAALPSSIIDGALWQYYGSRGLFYYGTITTLTAFFLFVLFLKKPRTTNQGL
jgi:MFS family permease